MTKLPKQLNINTTEHGSRKNSVSCKYSATLPRDVVDKIATKYEGRTFDNAISLLRKLYTHKDYDRFERMPLSSKRVKSYLRRSTAIFTEMRDELKVLRETKKAVNATHMKYAAWYRLESNNHFDKIRVEYVEYFPTLKTPERLCHKVSLFIDKLTLDLPCIEKMKDEIFKIVISRIDEARDVYVPRNSDRRETKIYERKNNVNFDESNGAYAKELLALWELDVDSNVYFPKHGKKKEIYKLFIKSKVDSILTSDLDALSKIDRVAVSALFPAHTHEIESKKNKTQRPYKTPRRNKTNRRLDSPLTNLSSYCVKYIRYENRPLIEYDLSNSQPTLLVALLKGNFNRILSTTISDYLYSYESVKRYLKSTLPLIESTSNYTSTISNSSNLSNLLTNLHASSGIHSTTNVVNTGFYDLTKHSNLYAFVCSVQGWNIKDEADKVKAKQFVFSCIYGAVNPGNAQGKERKKFMKYHFSDIVTQTDALKNEMVPHFRNLKSKNLKEYEGIAKKWRRGKFVVRSIQKMAEVSFPILLQRIEAYLFIDKIFVNMLNSGGSISGSGIPCATKHDSVLIPQGYEAKTETIIRKHLDQFIGAGEYRIKKTQYNKNAKANIATLYTEI